MLTGGKKQNLISVFLENMWSVIQDESNGITNIDRVGHSLDTSCLYNYFDIYVFKYINLLVYLNTMYFNISNGEN